MLSIPVAVGLVLNPKEFRLPRADSPITPPSTPITPPSSGSQPPSPIARRAGDANNDNLIDGLDYLVWLRNYNLNISGDDMQKLDSGDFDLNGRVDGLDYIIWLSNYDS